MSLTYKILSGVYDLIDVIYFRKNNANPRQAILRCISPKSKKVLEMCVGTASNSLLIAKSRPQLQVTGVDRSESMLKLAKEKVEKNQLQNIQILDRDATATGFDGESFDEVIISLVLHEVSKELADGILAESKRLLKPDGHFIVLEWEQSQSRLKQLLFLPIRLLEPKGFSQFFKMDKKPYFVSHGFKVEQEIHCDYSCVYKLRKNKKQGLNK